MPKKGPEGGQSGERIKDRDQAHAMANAGKRLRELARNANFDEIKDKFIKEAGEKEEEAGERYKEAKERAMTELSRIAEQIANIDEVQEVKVVSEGKSSRPLVDEIVMSEVKKLIKPKPISELTDSDYSQTDPDIIAIRESTGGLDLALREYYHKEKIRPNYNTSEMSEELASSQKFPDQAEIVKSE